MRKRVWAAVFAAVLLTLGMSAGATAATKGADRPFRASASGDVVFDLSNPRSCSFPDPYYQITTFIHFRGTATHMGAFRVDGSHCPTPTQSTQGLMTLTAADGAQLTATYLDDTVIDETFSHVYVNGWVTVTGGTGRFSGATGMLKMDGVVTISDPMALSWPAAFTFEGSITY